MSDSKDKKGEVVLYECGKYAAQKVADNNTKERDKLKEIEDREVELRIRQLKVLAKKFVKKCEEMDGVRAFASMMVGGAAMKYAVPLAEQFKNATNASDGIDEIIGLTGYAVETGIAIAGAVFVAQGVTYVACNAKKLVQERGLDKKFQAAYKNIKDKLKNSSLGKKIDKFSIVAKGRVKALETRVKAGLQKNTSETKQTRVVSQEMPQVMKAKMPNQGMGGNG